MRHGINLRIVLYLSGRSQKDTGDAGDESIIARRRIRMGQVLDGERDYLHHINVKDSKSDRVPNRVKREEEDSFFILFSRLTSHSDLFNRATFAYFTAYPSEYHLLYIQITE